MFAYALKSALCLVALYVPYLMMLRNETFARFNRCVLLCITALSLMLPLINLPWLAFSPLAGSANAFIELGELRMVAESSEAAAQQAADHTSGSWMWLHVLGCIYIIGIAVSLLVRTGQIIYLYQRIRRGTLWVHQEDGLTIYCHTEKIPPFSWMNEIVISQEDYDQCGDIILTHERAHARLKHSADMLLVMLCETIQWFNPFAWLLGDSMQEIHEYEADRAVLQQGVEMRKYQLLLIKKAVGNAWPAFTNNLKNCSLKKRFKMMTQKQTHPWRRICALYLLPVTLLILSAFACTSKDTIPFAAEGTFTPAESVENKANATFTVNTEAEEAYDKAEVMPEYPGGMKAMMEFLTQNCVFPEEAKDILINGRVIANFVIETTGAISEVKAVNTKLTYPEGSESISDEKKATIEKALAEEAIRVIKLMPNWKPGERGGEKIRTKFTIPVTFRNK